MDRLIHTVILIIVFMAITSCSTATNKEVRKKQDHNFRQSTLQTMQKLMDRYKLPSLSIAVSVDNLIIFSGAVGYANIELSKPADSETQYSVGSIAKPMTGIALARLVDAKKISLNTIVNELVPLQSSHRTITARQVASHTAGIPHETPEREKYEYDEVSDHISPTEVLDTFSGHALLFAPGTNFKYSSNGYILLSAVIETASKQNYVEYMKDSVWKQFQMNNTELDTSFAGQGKEATYYSGHDKEGNFILANTHRDRSFLFGGGGFISTPTDLVKFSRALYQPNYLSKKIVKELLTPVNLENGDRNPQNYGLGWRIGTAPRLANYNGEVIVAHHGGVTDEAATAYLYVIPEKKAAIAFATNTLPEKYWELRPIVEKILINYLLQLEEN